MMKAKKDTSEKIKPKEEAKKKAAPATKAKSAASPAAEKKPAVKKAPAKKATVPAKAKPRKAAPKAAVKKAEEVHPVAPVVAPKPVVPAVKVPSVVPGLKGGAGTVPSAVPGFKGGAGTVPSAPAAPAVAPKPVAPAVKAPSVVPGLKGGAGTVPSAPAAPKAVIPPAAPAVAPKPVAPAVKVPSAPVPPVAPVAPQVELREVEMHFPITLKDLSVRLQLKPSELIKMLMGMRVMATINQLLDEPTATALCQKFGVQVKKAMDDEELMLHAHAQEDEPAQMKSRPPIVTFMGHVDHGKTSLLDAIRKTKVVDSEHGGITQHIGAWRVTLAHGEITFLDTPGHEAFTAMRARGASITDIVVLVVAADDGVMPQTKEALDHAKAAGVSIIVAMNKMDKAGANPDQVKKQLAALGLTSEDWGGKTIMVPVSAKTGQGIDELLEMILLEAQMLELKANPARMARGVIIESKLSKGRGPVSTLLVRNGTLRQTDSIIVGQHYGKIRAMFNAFGQLVKEAGPAYPVEVLGLSGVAAAGEPFFAVEDERTARDLAMKRQEKERQAQVKSVKRVSLEDLHTQIVEGKIKELKLIIKSDVQGSLEAIKDVIEKLNISEIKLQIIHEGVGSINSSDVILAIASDALILGFNVTPDDLAKEQIAKEGIDCRVYNIIYELANDIKAAVEGMLEPKLKKVFMGRAEIKKVLRLTKGTIAGCYVNKGKIVRNATVDLVRNGQVVFSGHISSLKRFKDDVRDVAEGFECGISLQGFDAYQEGDMIEAHTTERIARTL